MRKEQIIKIFQNLGFSTSEHKDLGTLIKMNAKDAFVFSSITGANYLNRLSGITMKGRSEVFIHRSVFQNRHYIYSPGLFNRDINGYLTEGNSADYLMKSFPEIFNNDKLLYVHDVALRQTSNIEREVFENINKNESSRNYILYKNLQSGSVGEPFLEYLACYLFMKKGYLVENQVPWFQQGYDYKGKKLNGGIPDFSAFKATALKYLYKLEVMDEENGLNVNLIPVLKNFKLQFSSPEIPTTNYELIIGEAKTSSSSLPSAILQLNKYKEAELANELFSIIPGVKNNGMEDLGEIYLDNDMVHINKAASSVAVDIDSQETDNQWLNNYIKILLLGNLDFKK